LGKDTKHARDYHYTLVSDTSTSKVTYRLSMSYTR